MKDNFKVRFSAGISMFVIALIGLYTFNGAPFKVLFALFAVVAAIELLSFFERKHTFKNLMLAILECGLLYCSVLFVIQTDTPNFWYIILGVPGYDVFAYCFGKLYGGKIFGKSRPFPKISKNKTWEGTIFGLLIATVLVTLLIVVRGAFATDWIYLLCAPLALCGDLFESYLKRQFKIKDSNEIVIKQPLFKILEVFVGGSEGHGGFLDRIDSTAFATSALLVVMSLL